MKTPRTQITLLAFVLVITAGAFQPSMASGLRSQVSATEIPFGESVLLTLSKDARAAASPPDLTPLQADFRIMGTSQQSQTSIVNGHRTDSFSWLVTLTPKTKGTLTIPSISAGTDTSDAITIHVVDAAARPASATQAGGLDIEVSVEPGAHYVQQEIPITVRIHDGVGIRDARVIEPSGNDFLLTQTGDDQVKTVSSNGRETRVIERRYFLTPQRSGSLTIPPLTLVATLEARPARSSLFDGMGLPRGFGYPAFGASLFDEFFNRGREVSVSSEPLELDVKPKPTADAGWFLPAKEVELRAWWADGNLEFRVGEPVSRTIQLFALGASKEQLPDIPIRSVDGAQIYLERTADSSTDTAEGTAAIREFVVSVVPTRPGKVSLPSMEVKWWDTTRDAEQVATLPAQIVEVAPAAGSLSGSTPGLPAVAPVAPTSGHARQPLTSVAESPAGHAARNGAVLLLVLITLCATALLAVRHLRARRRDAAAATQASASGDRRHAAARLERDFVQGCKANDLTAAYSALSAWLSLIDPRLARPGTRYLTMSPELAFEIAAMERRLYAGSGGTSRWDGARLLKLFMREKRMLDPRSTVRKPASGLPELYPA